MSQNDTYECDVIGHTKNACILTILNRTICEQLAMIVCVCQGLFLSIGGGAVGVQELQYAYFNNCPVKTLQEA